MRSKTLLWACLPLLVAAPLLSADELFWVGGDDDKDNASGYTLFADADDSAFLGVTMEEETEHEEGGARITRVVDDSPAAKAGLQEGDIVVRFGGETVRGPVGLTKKIREREPGDAVEITVLRDGKRKSFDIELGERSTHWRSAYAVAPRVLQHLENIQLPEINVDLDELAGQLEGLQYRNLAPLEHLQQLKELEGMNFNFDFGNLEDLQNQLGNAYSFRCEEGDCVWNNALAFSGKPRLGVQLTETTPELRQHLGGSADRGVLVGKVIEDSAAEAAGVEVGDLIVGVGGDPIGSTSDLRRALSKREGETFDIEVIREGRSTHLSVTLEEREEDRPSGPRASLRIAPRPSSPPAPPAVAVAPAPVSAPPAAPVLAIPPTPAADVI